MQRLHELPARIVTVRDGEEDEHDNRVCEEVTHCCQRQNLPQTGLVEVDPPAETARISFDFRSVRSCMPETGRAHSQSVARDCRERIEKRNDVNNESQLLVRKQRVRQNEADDRKCKLARARVEVGRQRCEGKTEEQAAWQHGVDVPQIWRGLDAELRENTGIW